MQILALGILVVASLAVSKAGFACEALPDSRGRWLGTNKLLHGLDASLTSPFGMAFDPLLKRKRMHTGVDWAADLGTPVLAAARGRVIAAERRGEFGNAVLIDHGNGHQTFYAHLSKFSVSAGDCVTFGAIIGKVGMTGFVATPRLHFEVRENEKPVDPLAIPILQPDKN